MFTKPISFEPTGRLQKLPPYLFAEIDRKKRELISKGKDVIDLGVGDPDIPTPDFIVEALRQAATNPRNHRYALDQGMPELRHAIRDWFQNRFGVKLDPDKEILPLIGSKEGIGHLPLAVLNPGEVCLIPDPGYPVYRSGTLFAEGIPYTMPLLEKNQFLPDLSLIPADILKNAKLMFLNYPNNPTSQVVNKSFFEDVVKFAQEHRILIAHDAAYSEMGYEGYQSPSILQVPGAKEIAVELFSLSKTYSMTGWRVGFAVGNAQVLALLGKVKSNLDSGIFQAVQIAAIKALQEGQPALEKNLKIYQARRDLLVNGLRSLGWKIEAPRATFYCWIPVPPGYTSSELALKFLEELNIVVTPGNGFGPNGEGYFRISLTMAESRIMEALDRIKKSHPHYCKL
ncbi:MAG TPA: LL-diaminopimelate aminotransferase [Candidatus Omnitrophota bacterium]|nr:LL-diaminopimelate aminotransferase [Candidatus Omnitrophota bacterium]HPS37376.1 LL-diaminopimelate aminotransferase [Candidatus Omnitrophota bacterium]